MEGEGRGRGSTKRKTLITAAEAEAARKPGLTLESAVVQMLLKIVVQQDAHVRELMGVAYHTFVFSEKTTVIKGVLAATKKYFEWVKEEGKEHKRGPPFLHAWTAFVKSLGESDNTKSEDKKMLAAYWQEQIVQKTLEDLSLEVRFCRASECFKKQGEDIKFQNAVHGKGQAAGRLLGKGMCIKRWRKKGGPTAERGAHQTSEGPHQGAGGGAAERVRGQDEGARGLNPAAGLSDGGRDGRSFEISGGGGERSAATSACTGCTDREGARGAHAAAGDGGCGGRDFAESGGDGERSAATRDSAGCAMVVV